MPQTVIRIACKDQTLKTIEAPVIASGGVKENKVIFEFCPLWDGFTKTAVFSLNDGPPYQSVIDAENSCLIPAESIISAGTLHIGIYGVNSVGIKRTTELLDYDVMLGAAEGIEPAEPTPDVYDQILKEISSVAIPSEIVKSVNGKTGVVELTPKEIGAQPAGNYLIGETDPTVPAWAKQPTKPMYTAEEVGAEESGTVNAHNGSSEAHYDIRQLIEALQGRVESIDARVFEDTDTQYRIVAGGNSYTYILQNKDKDSSVWFDVSTITIPQENSSIDAAEVEEIVGKTYETKADAESKLSEANSYTDGKFLEVKSDVKDIREECETKADASGKLAEAKGYAATSVGTHNASADAHNDIRGLIAGLTNRLNTLANSDDTSLDQMSEVVAYIKANKSLIEGITTSKVNVTDIVNDLTTNVAEKPLSAAQGVALKELIDALQTEIGGKAGTTHEHSAADITSGVLPLSRGGTGRALTRTSNAIIRFSSSSDYFSTTATKSGAMYATSSNGSPQFGTLPIAQGGTGATDAATALTNLGAAAATHSHTSAEINGLDNLGTTVETLASSVAESKSDVKDLREDFLPHLSNTSNPHGVTLNQLGVTATATELNYVDGVTSAIQTQLNKKANDYTIEIYNGTGGNPKPVRFASFNYSTCNSENGIAAKISMVSGHGNGSSYAFLQDAIIRVNYSGGVEVDNFKYYGASTGTYDGANRQYGDIFWLTDTTNKIVDFYVLMGQYARIYQTPWKRLTYSTGGAVTQHTSCTVYSSGTKNWANNSDIALISDVSNLVNLDATVEELANSVREAKTDIKDFREEIAAFETKTDATNKLAEAKAYTNSGVTSANNYTDTKIAALINSAPSTLDTLGEIATAMQNNNDVVSALNNSIGSKANASDLTSHTGNKSNPHGVTAEQTGALPTSGGTLTGTLVAPAYKGDTSAVGLKPSDSNEINFSSNANYIYFGYENRMGSAGVVDTYKFGKHNGAGGAASGRIECGEVVEGGTTLSGKYAPASHQHVATDITSGTLPIARGGTGATSASAALSNLGALSTGGGTLSGSLNFSNSSSWITPYLLAFKNADPNSNPTYPYTGFYQWGNEWQVNARDANNTWAKNVMAINLDTGVATFYAVPTVGGSPLALKSDIPIGDGNLTLKPASGEGGQILLEASTADRTNNGIALDTANGDFRIFGLESADGTSRPGFGSVLQIDPYDKTILGGYSFDGTAARAIADGNGNNIASALSALSARIAALESTPMITFTIAGTAYTAEQGMTWGQWVYSKYNTAGAILTSDKRIQIGALVANNYGSGYQYDTYEIRAGAAYVISA